MSPSGANPTEGRQEPEAPERSPAAPQRAANPGSALAVAVTLALLAVLVWGLNPRQPKLRPAPLEPPSRTCPTTRTEFIPSNFTSGPGLNLDGLTPAARNQALLRLNLEPCTCGCRQSLAACLANNPSCAVAPHAAAAILKDAAAPAPHPAGAARPRP